MKYICNSCNKVFTQKSNYDYHINRKYKCRSSDDTNNLINQNSSIFTPNSSVFPPKTSVFPPNSSKNKTNLSDLPLDANNDINNSLFCCQFCNKSFSRKDNLVRHENDRCKEKKDKDIIKELIKQNQEMKQQINNLSEAINDMSKVSKGKKTSSINNKILINANNLTNSNNENSHNQTLTNSNNLTNTQTNNFIFNFGEEDIKKIPDENKLDALKCLSNSIYKFIELVNLNENYPENQTVLFNNIRSDIGQIIQNKQLIAKNQNAIIEDLINFRVEEMEELANIYKEENKLTKTEYNDLKELITFLQTSYLETEDVDGNVIKGDKDTTKKLKKIHKTIKELLYNNRLMVGQNIKKIITK
jgi:hypothetical protein